MARILLIVLLALTSTAGWSVTYVSKRCENLNGLYCNGTAYENCCGSTLESVSTGANLDETGVDGAVSVSLSGGTLYGCLHPAATPPTAAQLIAGASPCTSAKSIASPTTGLNSFVAGNSKRFAIGTPGSTYAASFLHDDGTNRFAYQMRTTASFTAPSGSAPGGTDLTNAGYFVTSAANGCSDSYTGLAARFSGGTTGPWCTHAKVNNSVTAAGRNVYYEEGEEFAGAALVIDWGGTSADFAEIDCYKWDGAKPITCTRGVDTAPVIGGFFDAACVPAFTCTIWTNKPAGHTVYTGMIRVVSSYVRVGYLQVERTVGVGVDVYGNNTVGSVHHVVVLLAGCAYTGKGCVLVQKGAQDVVVKGFDSVNHSACYVHAKSGGSSRKPSNNGCPDDTWGSNFTTTSNADNVLFEDLGCYLAIGECFNATRGATNIVFRGNDCSNSHSNCYYEDTTRDVVVESNIARGHFNNTGHFTSGPFGGAMAANIELPGYGNTSGTLYRNNLSINPTLTLRSMTFPGVTPETTEFLSYNNTRVGGNGTTQGHFLANRLANFDARNDINYMPALSASLQCTLSSLALGNPDMDYTHWGVTPSTSACRGAHDTSGDPFLPTTATDWNAMDYTVAVDIEDFRPGTGSPTLDTGDPAAVTTTCRDHTDFGTFIFTYMDTPYDPNLLAGGLSDWDKCAAVDYEGTPRSATTPDMGFLETP